MKRLAGMFVLVASLSATTVSFADYEQQEARAEELFEEAETHAPAHGGQLHLSDLANWEMLGAFFNFGVLLLIIGWVVKTKGNPALAARRADVEKELEEAQRLRTEAEARQAEITARLAKLDDEMAQIRSDMIKAGESERDRIVAQAEEKAARLRKDVSFRIDQQMKQLRIELTTEAASAAVSAAQALLQERTTDADRDELAEAYLARLDEVVQERSS